MTAQTDRTIKAMRFEFDRLATLVRGLGDGDLAHGTGAEKWDVSQVLGHLGSGAEINLAALDGAVRGTGAPEREFIEGVWARWDGMSREQRAEGFLDANETLVSRFEGLDSRTKDELRIAVWFPSGPMDVATFGVMRLNEVALHSWDVRVGFDPGARLAAETADLLLAHVAAFTGFFGKPAGLGGRQASVAVHLTSPERSFGLEIREAVRIVDVPAAPDAVLTAPAEWWVRMAAGRHAPEHTPPGVELTGGAITLDDLRLVFPGF